MSPPRLSFWLLAGLLICPLPRLRAASGSWQVNQSGLWSVASNWSGSVPAVAGDLAYLTNNIAIAVMVTNDASRIIGALNIGDSASSYFAFTVTNTGGATLTFNNNGTGARLVQSTTTASDVIATPIVLADNLKITNSSTLTLSGIISGVGYGLAKAGAGTLTLSGANTYSGGTSIAAGRLSLSGGNNRLTASGAVIFSGTATVDLAGGISQALGSLSFTNDIAAAITNTVVGTPSTLTLNGPADFWLGSEYAGATVATYTQTLDLPGLGTFTFNAPTNSFNVGGRTTRTATGLGVIDQGILTLAGTNTITALTVNIGAHAQSSGISEIGILSLGTSNTINADTFSLGALGKNTGTVIFRNGLTSPSLFLRGTDGVSPMTLWEIGSRSISGVLGSFGTNDTTGGMINALATALVIGESARTSAASVTTSGTLTMTEGFIDVMNLNLASDAAGGSGSIIRGNINLNGPGTLKAKTLTLGNQPGTDTVIANLTLAGGTLQAQAIQAGVGSATRTLNWNDGTIRNYDTSTDLILGANLTIPLSGLGHHTFVIDGGRTGTVNAVLSDATSGGTLTKQGGGTLCLAAANSYTGGTTINAGAMQFGDGTNDYFVSGPITNNASVVFNSFSNQICSSLISGPGTFTKTGNGTLNLTGLCTYTGSTTISAGTLSLSSTHAGTGDFTVQDSATLAVTAAGAAQLKPATLVFGQSVGAALDFSNVTSTATAPVLAGTLVFNGTTTLNIRSLSLLPGSYPLLGYSNRLGSGSLSLGAVPNGVTAYLDTSASPIRLVVASLTDRLWTGIVDGYWNTTTTNWTTNGTTITFADNDPVRFDDSASRFFVTNSVIVSPGSMLVTNDTHDYTISGAAIAGSTTLAKTGTGRLTLAGLNSFNGATTVGGGILEVDGSLGSGAVNVTGGVLNGTGSIGGTVIIQSAGALGAGTVASMGKLSINNSLTLVGGTAALRISKTGGFVTNDSVRGMSSVTYGGTLTVSNLTSDGIPLTAGNRFRLFDAASYSGSFSATNLPPLDPSLAWVWASASGTLSVVDPTNPDNGIYSFYVSPTGNDSTGNGSIGNPWRTPERARDYVRTTGLNVAMQGDITVYLRGGRYPLSQTLAFSSGDSADNGHFITYKSYPGEVARLSGGLPVTGWSPVPGKPCWVASVSTNAGFANYFRQLYVNGIRAERARSDWITNVGVFDNPATTQAVDGVTFTPASFKNYSHVSDLRMFRIGIFKVDEFPVTSITTNGTTGLVQVELQQPYCQTRYNYGSGASDANSLANTNQWMVIQAIEELDEPGEWYLDRAAQQVYYYPYSFEDMNTAEVYAPVVETLLSLTGDSTTDKVRNLRFENLIFEHGNWFFPRDYFIGGTQAEILMPALPPDSASAPYAFEVPGQILLNNTVGVQFLGNTLRHLASCGIHLFNGTRDTLIQGNYFHDLTATAVLGGRWGGDAPIPNQETCTNTVVADNVIRMIGLDFMAATAVDNFWHHGFQALHNDMADSQYMGFHQRTAALTIPDSAGTGGTVASFNRITLANNGSRYGVGDGAYIYTFGVWPDTTIQGNDVSFVDAATGKMRGMMFDNNSYGLTGISNVLRNVKSGLTGYFLYTSLSGYKNLLIDSFGDATVNNFSAVSNINFTTFSGTLPAAAQAVVDNAGLEPAYTNLLQFVYSGANLAKGKYAWASSQSGAGTAAGAAVDWSYTTLWQPQASDTNQCWWAVDLGAPCVVRRIEVAANTGSNVPDARRNFQVQGANDSTFTDATVLSEQNAVPFAYRRTGIANSWVKYPNSPRAFRYLRVIKTAPGTLNFSEFRVFGYSLATAPPLLTASASGGTLHLSWPANHLGWRLEGQTNSLNRGLGSNWFTWPGSAAVTSTNIPLDLVPTRFFRLVYP